MFNENFKIVNDGIHKYYPNLNIENMSKEYMDLIEKDNNYDNLISSGIIINFIDTKFPKFELFLDEQFFENDLYNLGKYNGLLNICNKITITINFVGYFLDMDLLEENFFIYILNKESLLKIFF